MTDKIVDNILDDLLGKVLRRPWYIKLYHKIKFSFQRFTYYIKSKMETCKYGFPLHQSYSFLEWHSQAVVPRLKKLKETTHSTPMDLTEQQWGDILDKIIWAFEKFDEVPKPIYSDDYDHRYKVEDSPYGKTYIPMNKTGTIDWSPVRDHDKKVNKGLDLFAKYYRDLWS